MLRNNRSCFGVRTKSGLRFRLTLGYVQIEFWFKVSRRSFGRHSKLSQYLSMHLHLQNLPLYLLLFSLLNMTIHSSFQIGNTPSTLGLNSIFSKTSFFSFRRYLLKVKKRSMVGYPEGSPPPIPQS